jgi:hypothetical protein
MREPRLKRQKKGPASRAFLVGAYRDRTGDLRLAKSYLLRNGALLGVRFLPG